MNKKQMKFIFVTGGVVSGLGKGVSAASIGKLLKSRGLNVFSLKFDPYLNVDPGLLSPLQHGEVYVTKDGGEADLDLGHYERLIDSDLTIESSVTSGKVYKTVLENETKGIYLGKTIQIIPHITNEIKKRLFDAFKAKAETDVCICEIGGTVGDIESLPFIEAVRQVRNELGSENTFFIHNTLVPYLYTSLEPKTKPTQHSVKELTGLGIQPDVLLLRSEKALDKETLDKTALFCNVKPGNVVFVQDCKSIYQVPLTLHKQNVDEIIVKQLKLKSKKTNDIAKWKNYVDKVLKITDVVNISIVGKYVELHDAYLSVVEALKHAANDLNRNVKINWIDSHELNSKNVKEKLRLTQGILIPGGFGDSGTEGMIEAIKYARINKIPLFGICLGMQLSLIEFARNVLNLKDASSQEFNLKCKNPIIIKPEEIINNNVHKFLRLGDHKCELLKGSLARKFYGKDTIVERYRHKYEFNRKYLKDFEKNGIIFSGKHEKSGFNDIIEIKDHPFFIAVQFHPEFKSRPLRPHPLFLNFIKAALKHE